MILLIRKRKLAVCFPAVCLLLAALAVCGGFLGKNVPVFREEAFSRRTVVIDAGHGGEDGGAVSADGVAESHINLAVALRLEQLLRFAGVSTEMTRREDVMVCDPGLAALRQRKVSDLHNRAAMVEAVSDAVLVSIHQNSLPSSTVTHGAQVFWNRRTGAEALAETMQRDLNAVVNTHRAKEAKPVSESIYLMDHVSAPAVLVECGFLSNGEETARLQQEPYQTTLAVTIAAGYLRWETGEEYT